MAADEDVFLREVDDDLQQDRAYAFIRKYGPIIGGIVVLIVAGVGITEIRGAGDARAARESAAAFQRLSDEAAARPEAGTGILLEGAEDLAAPYDGFARLKAATLALEAGDTTRAANALAAVADDGDLPGNIRDTARIRRAHILVNDDPAAALGAIDQVSTPSLLPLAQEARVYALAAQGEYTAAYAILRGLTVPGVDGVTAGLAARAGILLPVIDAGRKGVSLVPEASESETFIQDFADRLARDQERGVEDAVPSQVPSPAPPQLPSDAAQEDRP